MRKGELLLNWLFALGPLLLAIPMALLSGIAIQESTFLFWFMAILFIVGFGLFLSAKLSVIKAGHMFSFGPANMNKKYKVMYLSGYAVMVLAFIALASLAIVTI